MEIRDDLIVCRITKGRNYCLASIGLGAISDDSKSFNSEMEAIDWLKNEVKSMRKWVPKNADHLYGGKLIQPPPPMLSTPIVRDYVPEKSGIYFFYDENDSKPIYIGKANNIRSRIIDNNHPHIDKACSISFLLFDVNERELLRIEAGYIYAINPRLNWENVGKRHRREGDNG